MNFIQLKYYSKIFSTSKLSWVIMTWISFADAHLHLDTIHMFCILFPISTFEVESI